LGKGEEFLPLTEEEGRINKLRWWFES
jgi:hypothetical protein